MSLSRRAMFKHATVGGTAILGAAALPVPQAALAQDANPGEYILVCTENGVRIRSEPSLDGDVRGTINKGDRARLTGVSVESDGYRWVPVNVIGTNLNGWTTVEFFERPGGEIGWLPGTVVHVNSPRVNLHAGAGVNYEIVGNFNTGTEAVVNDGPTDADSYAWYNITIDNVTGWMAEDHLTEGRYANTTETSTAAATSTTATTGIISAASDYGITPNQTTDQTTAVNAMIEDVSAAGGGFIVMSPGTYRGHFMLRTNVWIGSLSPMRGGPVRFKGLGTDWVVDTDVNPDNRSYTYGMGVQGVYVEGADTNAPAKNTGGGIRFNRMAAGGGIFGCKVGFFADQGILMAPASGAPRGAGSNQVSRCYVDNVTLKRSRSQLIGAIEDRGIDNQWNNIESSTSQRAIENAKGTGGPFGAGWCVGVLAAGSSGEWVNVVGQLSDHGWFIDGQAHRITACRGDLSYAHDWVIDCQQSIIQSALALNGGRAATNTYDAFYLTSGSLGNRLQGHAIQTQSNRYRYNVNGNTNYGFNASTGDSGATYENVIDVSGFGYATAAYKNGGTSGAVPVYQQQIVRPTSGTAWNVAHCGFVAPNYGSPATITAFTGGGPQQTIKIYGHPNITIQHNNTIRNGDKANLRLAAERVYTYTNWGTRTNPWWVQEG